MSVNENELESQQFNNHLCNVIAYDCRCDYRNFYLDDNNEICLDISNYLNCCSYLIALQKLCENIIQCKKITYNNSENKYVKCLSTVSIEWIKQNYKIDLCFGWWLEEIIKHVKLLEYIVIVKEDYRYKGYIKGFEITKEDNFLCRYYYSIKYIDDDCDFTEILYPQRVYVNKDNTYTTHCQDINYDLYISYTVKSQYKNGKVVPDIDEHGNHILVCTNKSFEDPNDYILNTSQATFKQLYDLQQLMKNNITNQINTITNKLDSQIIDRILNINKESESLEQVVKKQQQTINELQEELKKQREEFEEYKSQRQKQLATIMSQM